MCRNPYTSAKRYQTGKFPTSVILGDFNDDKKLDLAVANNGDNTISVLLSNGNGSFQPRITYKTGNNPRSMISGDFNNDGNVDLAVVNRASGNINVFLNSCE